MGKDILIIADIEGSSQCLDRESAKLLGRGWPVACQGMSLDVAALVQSLIQAGAGKICIQDFHRTGYNIFPRPHTAPGDPGPGLSDRTGSRHRPSLPV